MSRWVLTCPKCNQDFTHSTIPVGQTPPGDLFAWLDFLGDKPDFPNGGLSLKCSNCKKASLYRRHQLLYRSD